MRDRAAWGARDPDPALLVPHSRKVRHLTVHHAGSHTGTTGPERYRIWQRLHMDERGWGDIAYHMIIAIDGTVYWARDLAMRGDTGTNYDPDRHFLVVVEGGFDVDVPTDAQLDRLRVVLAWASSRFDVSPNRIRGHRDWAATACPGANLYAYVRDGLAADVQAILDGGGVTLVG